MNGTPPVSVARLAAIRRIIDEVARAAGRSVTDIRLVAVSKTHPLEAVQALARAGQTDFGESTVQEALTKIGRLAPAPAWHFIGHVQSNKAKLIPGQFAWLHSLDSVALAAKLAQVAVQKSATLNALLEVNVTNDPRKHGVPQKAVFTFIEQMLEKKLTPILLRGLMTIGPHPATEHESRACFAGLRDLREACQRRFGLRDFCELSMGMSADYQAAIVEGATMLRLGTVIFGDRDYT